MAAPIQPIDLQNAKQDTDHIAAIATSTALTATDRLGQSKRTLAGVDAYATERVETLLETTTQAATVALGNLGYLPPVAYAAGIVLSATNQTVVYPAPGGVVYAPLLSALPFTTNGLFETDKFRVVQSEFAGISTDGTLTAEAGWTLVPKVKTVLNDPDVVLNAQAQALLDRTEKLRAIAGERFGTYSELRAYDGPTKSAQITGVMGTSAPAGIAGPFEMDESDNASIDNGGTVIVDALGRRWKRRYRKGTVEMAWFDLSGDGISDDTAKCQAALDSGARFVDTPAATVVGVAGTLILAENQRLRINGTLKRVGVGFDPIILVNNGASVKYGELDGSNVNCQAIVGSSRVNVSVKDVYVHGFGREAVASYAVGSAKWTIAGCRIENIGGAAISLEYTDDCDVYSNRIDTAYDGIRWWGGDSAVSNTIGIRKLRIHANSVKNVQGGIWGSLGSHISVTGNTVENCSDVGIDFEGCTDFSCVSNNALECANGCYSVFFGSLRGTFSSNTARNEISNGAGFYATTNSNYSNEALVITGNIFRTKGYCINAGNEGGSAKSLSNSRILGNDMIRTGNGPAIRVIRNDKLKISGNSITTISSPIGVELQSVLFSRVSNNELYGFGDTSTAPGAAGGVWLYAQDGEHPCQYNEVSGNRIEGYNYSVVDNCTANPAKSDNIIENNRLTNVYRSAGSGYNGVINNNRYIYALSNEIVTGTF